METIYTPNERTQDYVPVANQPDGPGLRYGKRGEATGLFPLASGGADLLRQRIGQFQAEARYFEGRVGTVHELRIVVINNDTQGMATVTYDGDFVPYLADIVREAGPWFDALLKDVWEGYESAADPKTQKLIAQSLVTAEMFYVRHHDLSVKDVTRLKRVGAALSELLDASA